MSLIEQLATLVGVHPSYTGTLGQHVIANDPARRALLKAMGFNLDDESLNNAITQLNQSKWLNILPAVHIEKIEDSTHSIKISLAKTEVMLLDWEITSEIENQLSNEPTTTLSGSINVNDLELIDKSYLKETLYCHYLLPLPMLNQGYYNLNISIDNQQTNCPLIFAPNKCYTSQEASKEKMWGYTAQLYSLRSNNNWGMGDFSDLFTLVEYSAKQQASTIGLNPLHPLYQQNPAHRSPYSPSSRSFLNPLYIDVSKVANFELCDVVQAKFNHQEFQKSLAEARENQWVDYPAVAKLKYEITELLFTDFCNHKEGVYKLMSSQFEKFKLKHGDDLTNFATFYALNEHFGLTDNAVYGWTDWPINFQDPASSEVQEFKQTHQIRIDYFCFLQWVAHEQLYEVTQTTKAKGMPVGLYLDLAVGCDGSGVDVWSDKQLYVAGASIGAPPDAMNPLGQNWGLTPINPVELQKQGYQPLVKALRSNMQYAGALRIDHILGLMRQYWVAPGMNADEGVYISFPFDDILQIIALESHRNKCIVIGEDLGNVPEGFSTTIQNAGLLSFKVMFFERWESGLFKRPENFPVDSVVTVATHDTATLSGWWQGIDLQWRQQLDLYPNEAAGVADRSARSGERENLIAALDDLNVIDMSKKPPLHPPQMNTELSIAVQKFLAASPSHIQLIPIEDALEIPQQVNIPGTINEHPNWLQKLPLLLENFWQVNSMNEIAKAMQTSRP